MSITLHKRSFDALLRPGKVDGMSYVRIVSTIEMRE